MNEGPERPPKSVKERFQDAGVSYEEAADAPELHAPVKLDGFEGVRNAQRLIEKVAKQCRGYASGPIIRDSFGNEHQKRREWRGTIGTELFTIYRENKLRANVISGVTGFLEALVGELDGDNIHTPQAEEVRRLHNEIPKDLIARYSSLSPEEKEEVAVKLDGVCRGFLRTVTGVAG